MLFITHLKVSLVCKPWKATHKKSQYLAFKAFSRQQETECQQAHFIIIESLQPDTVTSILHSLFSL